MEYWNVNLPDYTIPAEICPHIIGRKENKFFKEFWKDTKPSQTFCSISVIKIPCTGCSNYNRCELYQMNRKMEHQNESTS